MITSLRILCMSLLATGVLFAGYVSAEVLDLNASAHVLAVVTLKNTVDQGAYRQLDKLVPELRKISKSRVVKLECRYSGKPEQERDVENAYKLAGRIEKYFREHHKLDLDLWISVELAPLAEKSTYVMTLAVLSDDINKFDFVRIDPSKRNQ